MSVQYVVLGFEPETFQTRVSYHDQVGNCLEIKRSSLFSHYISVFVWQTFSLWLWLIEKTENKQKEAGVRPFNFF